MNSTCRLFQKGDRWYYCSAGIDNRRLRESGLVGDPDNYGDGFETQEDALSSAFCYGYGYRYYQVGEEPKKPIPRPYI